MQTIRLRPVLVWRPAGIGSIAGGQAPLVMAWRDYFTAQSKTADKEAVWEKLKLAKEAPLLYEEDFLKTARNYLDVPTWELDLAFELLDHRYNAGLDTMISTEWTPEELWKMSEAIAGLIHHAAGPNVCVIPRDVRKNFRYRVS